MIAMDVMGVPDLMLTSGPSRVRKRKGRGDGAEVRKHS